MERFETTAPRPPRARISDGWALCPKCGAKLCRVCAHAHAAGVELYCRAKNCKAARLLELG